MYLCRNQRVAPPTALGPLSDRTYSRLMRASAKLVSIVLAVLFLVAQIQGTAHGITHLRAGSGLQDSAPVHSAVCADCTAYAQAGAAPVAAPQLHSFVATGDLVPASVAVDRPERAPTLGFRSRAPPTASI